MDLFAIPFLAKDNPRGLSLYLSNNNKALSKLNEI